jgi:hypothetical protein
MLIRNTGGQDGASIAGCAAVESRVEDKGNAMRNRKRIDLRITDY